MAEPKNEYYIQIYKMDRQDIDFRTSKLFIHFSSNNIGLELLSDFTNILREEIDRQLSEEDARNEFEQDLYSLFQRFSTDIMVEGDVNNFQIDKMLSEYIAKLRGENLAEKYADIFEKLEDLRQERIRYWENILERVENNLGEYSLELTKLQKNRYFYK